MDITYLGHASFRLKGKKGIVVTDPFSSIVGMKYPNVTADIVTVSHDHPDHNAFEAVKPATAREKTFVVKAPGEYEISGISIFGYSSFHDDQKGEARGLNTIFSIIIDGVNIVHLGDIGHELSEEFIESLGEVHVLLCPVGGVYTIDSKKAVEIIQEIEPSYVIPMHYKTAEHDEKTFGQLQTLADFEKEYGIHSEPIKSLSVTPTTIPEQTTMVVLS